MTIDEKYIGYMKNITTALSDEDSLMIAQHARLENLFRRYALTSEQVGEVLSKTISAETQYINQYATAGAIELIKEERQQALIDAQIEKINAEILLLAQEQLKLDAEILLIEAQIAKLELENGLIEAQISKMGKEELLIDQQISKMDKEEDLIDQQIVKMNDEILLLKAEVEKMEEQISLIKAQTEQAQNQAALIIKQGDLIDRQEVGYDDNLIVKSAEYEGGLASFAVNAGSDDAQGAIDNFVATIAQLKARVST